MTSGDIALEREQDRITEQTRIALGPDDEQDDGGKQDGMIWDGQLSIPAEYEYLLNLDVYSLPYTYHSGWMAGFVSALNVISRANGARFIVDEGASNDAY